MYSWRVHRYIITMKIVIVLCAKVSHKERDIIRHLVVSPYKGWCIYRFLKTSGGDEIIQNMINYKFRKWEDAVASALHHHRWSFTILLRKWWPEFFSSYSKSYSQYRLGDLCHSESLPVFTSIRENLSLRILNLHVDYIISNSTDYLLSPGKAFSK